MTRLEAIAAEDCGYRKVLLGHCYVSIPLLRLSVAVLCLPVPVLVLVPAVGAESVAP
jgi:hypothetical protein